MKGTVQWHSPARRFYVQLYWNGKTEKFWSIIWNKEWLPLWDEKTAEKLLNAIRADIDKGEFDPRSYRPSNPLSLGQYYPKWLNEIDVTTKTKRDYKTALVKYVIPFFGDDLDIRKIRKADLTGFYKSISGSDKWKYNVMGALKAMLRWAYSNEEIKHVPPFPKMRHPESPEIQYLTMEQQEKVLAQIPSNHQPIFRFAMEYGLRVGEVRALKKDAIWDGKVYVKRAFSENKLMERTKTGEIRNPGMTPYAEKIIKSAPAHFSPFLFVREDDKPYTNKNLNKIWREAECKAGVSHIKLYNACRHSLGCQLLDEGHDLSFVQEVLGHKRQEMTKRYAKRTSQKIADVLSMRRVRGTIEVENEEAKSNKIK